jgi:hypothetical protein
MSLLRGALFAPLLALLLSPAMAAVDTAQAASRAVAGTNAFRKSQGLEPVQTDRALETAAQRFARYMAKTGKYGHGADGRRPPERAQAAGYEYCIVSENIAYQYRSSGFASAAALGEALVEGWKHSPEHRKNMLEPAVTETGVGIARDEGGRYFAVQMFGRPKRAALSFSLLNRSGERVEYRLGGKGYALAPRATRTHTICRPAKLEIGDRFRAQAADGARYRVGPGAGVQVLR